MISKSTLAKNAACNAITGLLDLNGTGLLNIYTVDSTLITALSLSNPSFALATDGTATANTIYDATALIDGTASTFWMTDGSDNQVYGGSITDMDGIGDLKLPTTTIPMDTTVAISSAIFIVP